jgi:DNA-binding cell septation regulator SpoVG
MQITDIKLFKVNHKTIKANGLLVVDGWLKLKFKLVNGKNGLFVAPPSEVYEDKKTQEKKYSNFWDLVGEKDVLRELQNEMNEAIIAAYSGDNQDNQGPSPELADQTMEKMRNNNRFAPPTNQVAKKNIPF